jgi:hypothetical protein
MCSGIPTATSPCAENPPETGPEKPFDFKAPDKPKQGCGKRLITAHT